MLAILDEYFAVKNMFPDQTIDCFANQVPMNSHYATFAPLRDGGCALQFDHIDLIAK